MKLSEYAAHDATGLMELVKRGETSPAELQQCAMQAIAQLNPSLNFMSGPAAVGEHGSGPFAGLPFLFKESHGCKGQPMMQGSRLTADLSASADSEFVARLKRAGVAPLGATTAPEFGLYCSTESTLHGATRNPWNLGHSVGGSSGGSSAVVAAGVVPVASSSDSGGSIRGPAHCTGTFGLKPSRARNLLDGKTDGGLFPFISYHVTTRSVRDSAAFLDVLQGASLGSRYSVARPDRPFPQEVGADPGKLRIGILRSSPLLTRLHPDCQTAIDMAGKLCADLGHSVEEGSPDLDWKVLMGAFLPAMMSVLPHSIAALESLTGRTAGVDTLEPMTLRALDYARTLTVPDLFKADAVFQIARQAVDRFFLDFDAWITPAGVSPAPRIGEFDPAASKEGVIEYAHRTFADYAAFTPLLNVTGHPAASVPLHHGAVSDLPVGVQIVTRLGDEATLLRLASQWEAAMPWRNRHPSHSIFKG
ncbi:amidase [Rhodanobacter sp. Si-c]|uniref:Amidase n=1 Tax=Rhodanobacter lycopersici TaxID=3162487 RepID=A0ABV3QJU9_9GAMM